MSLVKKISVCLGVIILLFSCNNITERKLEYAIHGIDISRYQEDIEWYKVEAQDIHFAFVKATEGHFHIDDYFCKNWEALSKTNIKKGAYHFFRPSVPAEAQFVNFKDMVELSDGDLPPVIDFEIVDTYSKEQIEAKLLQLLSLIQQHYGIKPILYTNLKLYNQYITSQFDEYPVWIARYSDKIPLLNFGNSWAFWQYGNKGRVEGIKGNVDLNVFHGHRVDLDSMCYSKPKISFINH